MSGSGSRFEATGQMVGGLGRRLSGLGRKASEAESPFGSSLGEFSPRKRVGLAIATLAVFAIAMSLRVPACDESFWVDELHTAWAVWDGPAEVASRASLGNQTPFYFWGVWVWKTLFGGGEVALRMSSVLSVSLAAAVLCGGIGIVRRSVACGFAAGMVLAVERNAIFFGTELRPYAWVLLAAAVAAVSFAAIVARDANRTGMRSVPRLGLLAALVAAGLLQPTSLGVLGLPPLLLSLRRRFVMPVLATMALLAAVLWPMTLGEVWRRREQWSGFASAGSLRDVWQIWDWLPLVVAPAAVWVLACLLAWGVACRLSKPVNACGPRGGIWVWGVIVLGGTFAYWGASYFGGVPVWHRRYLIAVLPFLAVVTGEAVAAVGLASRGCRGGRFLVIAAAVGLPGGVAWYQGTLADLGKGSPLVRRGEDWRSASAWLGERVDARERVYLMSGLIEASRYLESGWRAREETTRDELEYLRFPLLGPYRLSGSRTSRSVTPRSVTIRPVTIRPVRGDATFATGWLDTEVPGAGDPGSVYLVARLPAGHLQKWFDAVSGTIDPRLSVDEIEIRGFGGVSVARLPIREEREQDEAVPIIAK